MKYVTPKFIKEKYNLSSTTFWRLKNACLLSPYEDAIRLISERKYEVNEQRFDEFLNWRSEQLKKERFGLE